MKNRLVLFSCFSAIMLGLMFWSFTMKFQKLYDPELDGFVPNEATAIKIAEAIWLPVFGDEISNYKPYQAQLKDGKVWVVRGKLISGLGGVPYIEIQKSDCKILKISHGK